MSKQRGNIEADENFLRSIALPEATDTYTVIAHGTIIDKVRSELNKNGFTIDEEKYYATIDGEIALGKVYIKSDKDPDMGMIFTWWNSYNKRVKFGCAVGSFIYDNRASLIGSEGMSWIRKHTGTADEEANSIMEQLIQAADTYFNKIIAEKNKMKNMPLSVEDYGCIMGALYFEHELITPTQASAVIQERKKPTNNYSDRDTLWGLYKILMFGIEGMDITKWVKSQQKLHHMIMTEYAIKVELPEITSGPNKDTMLCETCQEVDCECPVDDSPQIQGIPNGDTMSDTDDEDEVTETVSKITAVQTELEQLHAKALVDYWMSSHYDDAKTFEENVTAFKDWAPEPSEKKEDKVDYASTEEASIHYEDSNQGDEDPFEEDPFEEEVVYVTAEDLAAKHGVDISAHTLSEEQIELIKEEHGKADQTIVFEEPIHNDLNLDMTDEIKEVLAKVDEPVELIDPKDSFVFPTDLDNPEKLSASLEVPEEVLEQAKEIEARMLKLYGEVKPYHIDEDEDLVIIDETLECFSI